MATIVVEVHVPVPGDEQWVEDVEDFLADLEDAGEIEVYDDSERVGDVQVFYLTGRSAEPLLAAARRVATRTGVPQGAFAIVADDKAAHGIGKRVALPAR